MTTARALLRRLLSHGRIDPRVPPGGAPRQPPAENRLEAAKQRLKQAIPPPEGVAPAEEPPPVLNNPPPK